MRAIKGARGSFSPHPPGAPARLKIEVLLVISPADDVLKDQTPQMRSKIASSRDDEELQVEQKGMPPSQNSPQVVRQVVGMVFCRRWCSARPAPIEAAARRDHGNGPQGDVGKTLD